MMHLIEDRTLLDANVSDGRQKSTKSIVINIAVP